MSPVSRGRKNAKSRRPGQRVLRVVPEVPEECDCPECSDAEFDPAAFITELATAAGELLTVDDPMEAELFGASFVAMGDRAGEGFTEALAEGMVPELAQLATPESVAALLAIDAVESRAGAAEAARSLLAAGVPAPTWAGELAEPVTAGVCRRHSDVTGEASMLLCSFERSGRSHGFIVQVDHVDCDAAVDIMMVPGETLGEVTAMIQADGHRDGMTLTAEDLAPAEFRWQVERALDARAVHDQEIDEPDLIDDPDDEDGGAYHPAAVLLRARMNALPEPPRPPAAHGGGDDGPARPIPAGGRRQPGAILPKLPSKRKKSDGPAPIYQVKISLRGARPPIWRRLELPGDISLAGLHRTIQTAFGWEDSHLHVFETPYGAFGVADREMGHRAEKPVTLEQVAPGAGNQVHYLYDFGDNWEHEIVVEKLLDRQAVAYPRCTGGRRAAPPDDCGGVWGYAELVKVLADPAHPDHEEQLEWLGLRSADDFAPARFDADEVNRALNGPEAR